MDNSSHAAPGWRTSHVLELFLTDLHPTPRLFPAIDDAGERLGDACLEARPLGSPPLRSGASAISVVAGRYARWLASWWTAFWAEPAR